MIHYRSLLVASLFVSGGCGSNDAAPADLANGHPSPDGDAGHGARDLAAHDDASAVTVDFAGQPPGACKRGIASNQPPGAAFARTASQSGIVWWYNWATHGSGNDPSIEFVPMVWGTGSLNDTLPSDAKFVLGFNEPNFKAQSNLTAQQAANDWPTIEAHAMGNPIVSPGVNFCGSASNPSGCTDPAVTDPYTYLKDFLADCAGCEVDHIAVHWYNCDLPSLQAYIEGNGGGLQGFLQFNKPIWVTELACDNSHPVAEQKAYMQAAIPYLEGNPNVFRYSWFSSSAISNAVLQNGDGSLTELGQTYVSLPQNCP
jgi:hypothetical protein